MQRLAPVGCVLAIPITAHADDHDNVHAAASAVGLILAAGWEYGLKGHIAPKTCRWCEPDSWDAGVRDRLVWSNTDRASKISDVTAVIAILSSLGSPCAAGSPSRLDDAARIADSITASEIVIAITQLSFARQRPFAQRSAMGSWR